jgi:hypothetical protein
LSTSIAKIVDNVAVDIRVTPEFTPPEGETWVESPAWLLPRSLYNGGAWTKPDGSPYTDEEQQIVSTQLSLYSRLTAGERRALRAMANTEGAAGDAALQVEGAFFSAVETESRDPQTRALIGAAIQLGVLSGVARARELLNDPGFTLE